MAPSSPRSAYNLYFCFYKQIHQHPSLRFQATSIDKTNRGLYKRFVRSVLSASAEELPNNENGKTEKEKYFGNESFTDMSRQVGKSWREVDEATRSVFSELAGEDSDRYQRELFESYQSFTASIPKVDFNGQKSESLPRKKSSSVKVQGRRKRNSAHKQSDCNVAANHVQGHNKWQNEELLETYQSIANQSSETQSVGFNHHDREILPQVSTEECHQTGDRSTLTPAQNNSIGVGNSSYRSESQLNQRKEEREYFKKELFKSYQSVINHSTPMPSLGFNYSSGQTWSPKEADIAQGQDQAMCNSTHTDSYKCDNDSKAWYGLKGTDQAQNSTRSRCASIHAPYQITQVDMTDKEIMTIVTSIWGISAHALSAQFKSGQHLASNEDLSELLSGIDWSTPY